MNEYLHQTRTATYGFVISVPLLLAYEALILMANQGATRQIRVGADIWLKQLLAGLGGTGHLFLGCAVAGIGLVIMLKERRESITLRLRYLVGMLGESCLYAIVVALAIASLTQRLFGSVAPVALADAPPASLLFNIALSLGAGLYEELFFRVILVGLMYVVLRHLTGFKVKSYLLATVIGAALFSGVHHLGEFGDPFAWSVFFYRFMFGLVLQGLLLARGFGIAAWTHALYDLLVVLLTGSL